MPLSVGRRRARGQEWKHARQRLDGVKRACNRGGGGAAQQGSEKQKQKQKQYARGDKKRRVSSLCQRDKRQREMGDGKWGKRKKVWRAIRLEVREGGN